MELARELGVSQPMISYWERDRGEPDEAFRQKLETILGPLTGVSAGEATSRDSDDDEDQEPVDGLERDEPTGLDEYPIDSLMIRTEHRTVHELLRRIEKNQLILTPDFQRDFVWDDLRQSRLIESALMRIPLPVMYLAEDVLGRLIVVDGLQRITTFWRFLKNELVLGVDKPELKGRRFRDLDIRLQNRVEDTQLTLYIVDSKVKDQVRLDIFERVNSGIPLTRQQMRNCIYNGAGSRWLGERAAFQPFATLFSAKQRDDLAKSMRDREIINRFAAFWLLGWEKYRGDMDEFLGAALRGMNEATDAELQRMTEGFQRGVENNVALFGTLAFRKHTEASDGRGTRFNVALFDVMCTVLGRYDTGRIARARTELRLAFFKSLRDEEVGRAVSYWTSQRDKIKLRFVRISAALEEVLGVP